MDQTLSPAALQSLREREDTSCQHALCASLAGPQPKEFPDRAKQRRGGTVAGRRPPVPTAVLAGICTGGMTWTALAHHLRAANQLSGLARVRFVISCEFPYLRRD